MAIWSYEINKIQKLCESFSGLLPDLEKELERLIRAEDENMILLYSRRSLEVIITDLCECELKRDRGTEPLRGIIDKLNKEKKIPPHIVSSMYGLNELSTYGTHPKDFDPEQVKPVLINLNIIIRWYLKYKNIVVRVREAGDKKVVLEEAGRGEMVEVLDKSVNVGEKKLISIIAFAVLIIIAAILIYPKIFKGDSLENLRSSGSRVAVAVMPFQNMTNDTIWNIWQVGIQNEIIASLTNSKELSVRQTESINNLIQDKGLTDYASLTPSAASKISQKLDANFFVFGSIKQAGRKIRVNIQLIDSKSEEIFKSFQVDGNEEGILDITDSLSVVLRDFILITILEKDVIKDFRPLISTNSSKAYRYYLYGNQALYKYDYPTSREWYQRAIDEDSTFTEAIRLLIYSYHNQYYFEESKKLCLRYYQKRDQMPELEKLWADVIYARLFETPQEEIKYLKLLTGYDDEMPVPHYNLGWTYIRLGYYDLSITEFERELEIYKKWDSRPRWSLSYLTLGNAYHEIGMYKKEIKLYRRAERDFPDDPGIMRNQSALYFTLGHTSKATQYLEKFIIISRNNSVSDANIRKDLIWIYTESGKFDQAEEILREDLSLEPENPDRLNDLAFFLIDKDRNINEGMGLIDKALQSDKNNYSYMHTKGWGLYKQGKYQEALEMLQKSWDLRRVKAVYDHEAYLHLEAARKAVAEKE